MRSYTFKRDGENNMKRGHPTDKHAMQYCYDLAQSGEAKPVFAYHGTTLIGGADRGKLYDAAEAQKVLDAAKA